MLELSQRPSEAFYLTSVFCHLVNKHKKKPHRQLTGSRFNSFSRVASQCLLCLKGGAVSWAAWTQHSRDTRGALVREQRGIWRSRDRDRRMSHAGLLGGDGGGRWRREAWTRGGVRARSLKCLVSGSVLKVFFWRDETFYSHLIFPRIQSLFTTDSPGMLCCNYYFV